ncbi:hypothetical protein [Anaerotignum sp.]
MTNQKNRFFTLVFSCCPGAGEMYMGLYKQGISLMLLFFGTVAVSAWTRLDELCILLPVVWCYSFFHTHNLRQMPAETFAEVEDKYIFEERFDFREDWKLTEKHQRLFGWLLLFLGLSIIWRTGLDLLGTFFQMSNLFWYLNRSIPQVIMALIVLYGALRLMRAPKDGAAEESMETAEEEKTTN